MLLQISEYVKYSTDITVSSVRGTSFQILVSHACEHNPVFVRLITWIFFIKIFWLGLKTVLGKIYELLGVLAEVHPSDMVNNSDKLYKAYLGELKEQVCLHIIWQLHEIYL